MKTILLTLLLMCLFANVLMAHPPRPVKSAKARVAANDKPLPPVRIHRIH